MFRLDGKAALVTGAATGLGAAIAAALPESGADLAISDRAGVSLEETAARVRSHGRTHNATISHSHSPPPSVVGPATPALWRCHP
jgi:NAD(P)-dependent dehydrogenase (short-subunit alcohol dehydrogenase family)